MINKSEDERVNYFEEWCSITDLESIACVLYYEITKGLQRNLSNEFGEGTCKKEKDLIEDILNIRRRKLDDNFIWTDYYKKQFLELNETLMNGFSMAYDEAKAQFQILKERINRKDSYLNGFNIDIKLSPLILEPNEDDYILEERGNGICYLLYNILPDTLWADSVYYENDNLNDLNMKKYENDDENYNINEYLGNKQFADSFICWGMYDLLSCSSKVLSWYDILKINEIWVEVNITHQHFIDDIGKGTFWNDGVQSLSDNEAENFRQEYMSRLSKDMSGLSVEMLVDEMSAWERMGPYKRVKFQGNNDDKIDFKKMYSMSIEKEPQILVKDAQIDLSDEELQQVKDFVSKNRKALINMSNGKISLLDFAESLGCFKKEGNNYDI